MKALNVKKINLSLNPWTEYKPSMVKIYRKDIRLLLKETNSLIQKHNKSKDVDIKREIRYDIDRNCRYLINYNHISPKIEKWANSILKEP